MKPGDHSTLNRLLDAIDSKLDRGCVLRDRAQSETDALRAIGRIDALSEIRSLVVSALRRSR